MCDPTPDEAAAPQVSLDDLAAAIYDYDPPAAGIPLRCTCDYAGMPGENHKPHCEIEGGPHAECALRIHELEAERDSLRAEVERTTWERDTARAQVAAAEAVQGRMADSLPSDGPWQSWSERDLAVRDYEGDLAMALATEADPVADRRIEAEWQRDELRDELDAIRAREQAVRPLLDAVEGWANDAGAGTALVLLGVLVDYERAIAALGPATPQEDNRG